MKRWLLALMAWAALCCCGQGRLYAVTFGGSVLEGLGPARTAPVYGFGMNSQKARWFGVNYWPHQVGHSGFYGDFRQWSYRWGY